jgi:hypothetical protein
MQGWYNTNGSTLVQTTDHSNDWGELSTSKYNAGIHKYMLYIKHLLQYYVCTQ